MLGKTPNKVYDPFLKVGLGYQNLERLKKAIAAQPKMYEGERLHCTTLKQKNESLVLQKEKISSEFKDIQANLLKRIKILKNDFKRSQAQSVESSNSVRRAKSKDTKAKNRVLKNTNVKIPFTNARKVSSSVSIGSNKRGTMNLIMFFMLSHKKCVARYALSIDSRVKKPLFTSPIAGKSRNIGATSVVVKSRFSVAKTPTATNKVSSASSLSPDSSQSRTLGNYMKNKIATSRKWQKSLCYPTNDRDDLGKMKPKAHIGIFIGYSESSRGFRIYNRQTKKIMETIHVKFDEHTTMASDCNNLGPGFNCLNFQDSLEDSQSVPSKEDLDNLFGPLYEEYYAQRTLEVSDDSAANTLPNEDTTLSSSIVVEEDEAPQIVTSSEEPIANEPTTPVSTENANEPVQKDIAAFDLNEFYHLFHSPVLEEAESSSTFHDPLNMHEFYQTHRSTNKWTKNHQIEQVIGDPSKPVMTRHRIHINAKMCMYALTVSTTEPKNIKEVMLDHSWIESMQEDLNPFKRLDVRNLSNAMLVETS
ncbi:retrovirus-related pol polyprotein from transposon TNT 1-94 [Tanacetum coccineum]